MKTMSLSTRSPAFVVLLCPTCVVFAAGMWGCAAKNGQRDTLKEYEYSRRTLQKEKQEALRAAEEEASPKRPETAAEGYERLGDAHLSQGNKEMAFFQYTKAVGLDPTRVGVRYKRGHLFLERELIKEAEGEFRAILKTDPKEALAYEGLGLTSLKMRKSGSQRRTSGRPWVSTLISGRRIMCSGWSTIIAGNLKPRSSNIGEPSP